MHIYFKINLEVAFQFYFAQHKIHKVCQAFFVIYKEFSRGFQEKPKHDSLCIASGSVHTIWRYS